MGTEVITVRINIKTPGWCYFFCGANISYEISRIPKGRDTPVHKKSRIDRLLKYSSSFFFFACAYDHPNKECNLIT